MTTDTDTPAQDPATAPPIAPDGPGGDEATDTAHDAVDAPERPDDAPTPDQYLPAPSHPETGVVSFNARQRQVTASVIGRDLTEDELDFFLSRCIRTGLDPFANQIYAWKDNGKLVTMTSIDGLRLVSERTGHLIGQRGPEYLCHDGVSWVDVWAGDIARSDDGQWRPPLAARFWVLRDDQEEWISGVATWDEFNRAGNARNKNWQAPPTGMPSHMLGKIAEALARRKAFPNELAGVYTDDEIDRATAVASAPGGSDDLPSIDDPLAIAATEALEAIRAADADAAKNVDRWWAENYVKKVLNTTLGKAKSIRNGALYRFAPGSPHIAAVADLMLKGADKILGGDDPATVKLRHAIDGKEAPADDPAEDPEFGEPLPDDPPPAPAPIDAQAATSTPGPFTDSEMAVLVALEDIGAGSVADIALHLGITEAASLRVTVTDLFDRDLLQLARSTEKGQPREYVVDADAVAQLTADHEGTP